MSKLEVGSEQQAKIISEQLLTIFGDLESLVREISKRVNDEQAHSFRQAIGSVCGTLVLDVLGPLYRAYPQIRPDSWPEEE